MRRTAAITVLFCLLSVAVGAQENDASLSQQLANPMAALISVPTQINYDDGLGVRNDGSILQINVQPVLPFQLNDSWNLITRTIIPFIAQENVTGQGEKESGIGDVVESVFFSPIQPTKGGWIWGAGPVLLLPTASNDALGSNQWALGPTFVGLRQKAPWTVGLLANHLWTVLGEDDRSDINASYIEPWLSFGTQGGTTLSMSAECSYDWNASEWLVPLVATAAHLFDGGPFPFSIGLAARYWAETPEGGPEGWGGRLQFTFLFAK